MSSNYDLIRDENLLEYGRGTRHLAFLGKLYTDRTHFIFEILQNAEDANADKVFFELEKDRLLVRHNGRLFDEQDVRGICGVGAGTKAADLTKIGKFGIGFKSVYAYTLTPEIHSGDEHFRIEGFVRPHGLEAESSGEGYTTLFVFPFNHPDHDAAKSFPEIERAFDNLGVETLLFLRNIQEISWGSVDGRSGKCSRRAYPRTGKGASARRVRLASGETDARDWLIFERAIIDQKTDRPIFVEVGFHLQKDQKTGKEFVARVERSRSPLVVYFPTQKQTGLGFLIQGPYRTTPARDNVPSEDDWNEMLVKETAKLLIDALLSLKEANLLTVELLDTLPIRAGDFPQDSMFYPIFDAVKGALRDHPLLPAWPGGFTTATQAKLARGKELRGLVGSKHLQILYGSERPFRWLSGDITETRTPDLLRYLINVLQIEVIEPENIASRFTSSFLEQQNDEWIIKLYKFLLGQADLWKAKTSGYYSREGIARQRPIIRLRDGKHVVPFEFGNIPKAFLPPPQRTKLTLGNKATLSEVKRSIASDPTALEFLKALGLSVPDNYDAVIGGILPKYCANGIIKVSQSENADDLTQIANAATNRSSEKAKTVISTAIRSKCIRAENPVTQQIQFKQPNHVYWPSTELQEFFSGNPDAWFVSSKLEALRNFLVLDLGVATKARIAKHPVNEHGQVEVCDRDGWHQRGENWFDPDCWIDGLDYALRSPTLSKARSLWNDILISERLWHCICGRVTSCTRKDFSYAKTSEKYSKAGKLLVSEPWLPCNDGSFKKPSDLIPEELPDGFAVCEDLARALEMKQPASKQTGELLRLAETTGIPKQLLLFATEHPDEIARAMEEFEKRRTQAQSQVICDSKGGDAPIGSGEEFSKALENAFAKKGQIAQIDGEQPNEGNSTGPLANPERRRSKIGDEIDDAREKEPPIGQRFAMVSRKVWEAADSTIRQFLAEEYQGKCQICGGGFFRRDGTPYFEGLYLVPRTQARWIDRPGNTLCLCADCCAKMLHGAFEVKDMVKQITSLRIRAEGGNGELLVNVVLCGRPSRIMFSERHLLDLQEMLRRNDDMEISIENDILLQSGANLER